LSYASRWFQSPRGGRIEARLEQAEITLPLEKYSTGGRRAGRR